MSDAMGIDCPTKKSAAGRKPVATEDRAREVVEAFRREGRAISTAGIKGVIGGSTETVVRILEKLGELPDRIDVTSPLPMALTKAFHQSVQDQTLSVRAECQKQIDSVRELLDQVLFLLLDSDKEYRSKVSEVEALRSRCDALQGEATVANIALEKVSAEVGSLREQAAAATTAEAVMAEQLKSALASEQQAEAQLEEERRRHEATRGELARSQETLAGVSLQAEEHLRELERTEDAWDVERRLKYEHTEKLYALLEIVAEREAGIKYALDEVKGSPGRQAMSAEPTKRGVIHAGVQQLLDIALPGRAQKSNEPEPPDDDDTIPF